MNDLNEFKAAQALNAIAGILATYQHNEEFSDGDLLDLVVEILEGFGLVPFGDHDEVTA